MKFKQLEYFIATADAGSLSKAAEALYTSQPNVSKVINSFEKELNIRLFDRNRKGVTLSGEGKRLYKYAKVVLQNINLINTVVIEEAKKKFCISSYPSNRISKLFCQYYQQIKDENIQFEFLEGTVEEIIDNVKNFNSEIGIVYVAASQKNTFTHIVEHKKLEYNEISREGISVYVGKKSPLYKQKTISFSELRAFTFVQPSKDYFSMEHHLEEISFGAVCMKGLNNVVSTNSNHVLVNLLLETKVCNLGVDFYNTDTKQYDIHAVAIEDCEECLSFGYVKRGKEELSEEAVQFLEILKKAVTRRIMLRDIT